MIHFTTDPVPTLIINDQSYTGISMLEALNMILKNQEQYPDLHHSDVERYFKLVALFHQRNEIPQLGFRLQDSQAVLPTKRIIDVGYDLTIISVFKHISDKITMFETEVALDIPIGYYVEMVPRSSISKTGYMLANSVGVIDPGYTGTIKVPLIKIDDSMPNIELPVRIAQLILKPYVVSHGTQVETIASSTRGIGGFGSTG